MPDHEAGDFEAIAWLDWGLRLGNDVHRSPLNPSGRHKRLLAGVIGRFDAEAGALHVIAPPDSERGSNPPSPSADAAPTRLRRVYTVNQLAGADARTESEHAVIFAAGNGAPASSADAAIVEAGLRTRDVPAVWLTSGPAPDAASVIRSLIELEQGRYSLLEISRSSDRPAFDDFALRAIGVVHHACGWACDASPLAGPASVPRLSPRERETLAHLLAGASEKQVAALLQRSPHTVHSYVKRIYRQLGVTSRAELLSIFLADGSRL